MREFQNGLKWQFLPSYVVRGALARVAILFYVWTTELPTIQQKLKNENARMKRCYVTRIQRRSCFCARNCKTHFSESLWTFSLKIEKVGNNGYGFYRLFVSLRFKVTHQKEERTASGWSTTQKLVVTLLRAKRRRKCLIFMLRVEAR